MFERLEEVIGAIATGFAAPATRWHEKNLEAELNRMEHEYRMEEVYNERLQDFYCYRIEMARMDAAQSYLELAIECVNKGIAIPALPHHNDSYYIE